MTKTEDKQHAHAIYAPSSAYRNLNCLGAISMCEKAEKKRIAEGRKKKESIYASEGTEAHKWIDLALNADDPEAVLKACKDQEMAGYVKQYLAFNDELTINFSKVFPSIETLTECRVVYDKELWGTLDRALIGKTPKRKEAVIADFKYGRGVEVDAEENEQLTCYALCLEKMRKLRFDKVHAFVYQPRTPGDPFSRWTMTREYLDTQEKRIVDNKRQCLQILKDDVGEQHTNAGEWCRFCEAKTICPSFLADADNNALQVINGTPEIVIDVPGLTMDQKLAIFTRRKVITRVLDEVAAELHDRAVAGEDIPGYKLVKGKQVRQWSADDAYITGEALKKLGVTEPYAAPKVIGIGAVEKLIGKGKIADLTCLTTASVQLVPLDDKRDAIKLGMEDMSEIDFSKID